MKILIPVDGSSRALGALAYVVELSALLKDAPQVLLLNVQWNMAAGNVKLLISKETINEYYVEHGKAALDSARKVLEQAGLAYQYHISIGNPAEAIVQYAKQHQVDQVVMSRHGEGGLQSLLLGSVVNRVLQLAEFPVVLVK